MDEGLTVKGLISWMSGNATWTRVDGTTVERKVLVAVRDKENNSFRFDASVTSVDVDDFDSSLLIITVKEEG